MYLRPLPLPPPPPLALAVAVAVADGALDAQSMPSAFGRVAHPAHGVVAGDGQQLEAGVEQQHLRGP